MATANKNRERVAAILESDTSAIIIDWLDRVERDGDLTRVPLSKEERTEHLPKLIWELARRLRVPRKPGTKAAVRHGKARRSQGYSVPMIEKESRILQVCIFETLQNNLSTEDFSLLLTDAMTLDEGIDSQLKQTLTSFMRQTARIAA